MKTKTKSNVQSFGRMIKHFVKFSSADNFQDKEVICSQKDFQNWPKYNTVSPEKRLLFVKFLHYWAPRDPSTIFLATSFTLKNASKLGFHVFLENI